MHKKVITAGILSSFIWAGVLAISRGLPQGVCTFLKGMTFGVFSGAIENAQSGFYYDVPNQNMPTVIFLMLFSIAFFIYLAVLIGVVKNRADKKTFFAIIFFAILFRIILLPSIPVHENDIYRYIWDGKMLINGINPYKFAPGDLESLEAGYSRDVYDMDVDEIIKSKTFSGQEKLELARINKLRSKNPTFFYRIGHRWVPTIYPPFAQVIFSLASLIREDSVFVMKGVFVIFDILAIIVISKLLLYFNKDPCLSIIYGWSPLVLKETANSGHYDSIAIFTMLMALYLLFSGKRLAGIISFAIAAASKFFPILLLPIYRGIIKFRYYVIFGLSLIAFYAPFLLWQNAGAAKVFKGLLVYSEKWAYNGSIFVFFQSLFKAFNVRLFSELFLPKMAVGLIFIAVLLFLSLRESENESFILYRSFVVSALLFLLNPVGDPWYFCWVIPFLCFFHYYSFIILSWLLVFSYLSFSRELGAFTIASLQIPVLNTLQYMPFYTLLIFEIIMRKKKKAAYV